MIFLHNPVSRSAAEPPMIEAFAKISEASKMLMESGFTPITVATALTQVGTALGVDRVSLFENQPFPVRGRLLSDARYAWAANGLTALTDVAATKQISLRELSPLWVDALAAGQTVSCVTSAAAPRMKLLLNEIKTQSLLLAPIQVGKEKWGFIVLEDCHARARVDGRGDHPAQGPGRRARHGAAPPADALLALPDAHAAGRDDGAGRNPLSRIPLAAFQV